MSKIYENLDALIGKTPLLRLSNYALRKGMEATLLAKLEFFNPAGSVKDRVAKAMLDDAEERGILKPGSVIVEPTSGNTGIGIAAVAASRGYRVILTMPDSMSLERRNLLKAYGAELVLTPGAMGMAGAVAKAEELASRMPDAFIPGQFTNAANPATHRVATGSEIWSDTGGDIDFFVSGIGTGGTITGVGEYLKSKNEEIQIIAVEPADSAILSGRKAGSHMIQGIGAGFIPQVLNTSIYNEIVQVSGEDAVHSCRELCKTEGVLVGISSGAALHAATTVAGRPENSGKTVVVLFPDGGERYLSTPSFVQEEAD